MSFELKPHNEQAYNNTTEMYKKSNLVAIIHATGTGKTYIGGKLIEDNPDKKFLYLSPTNIILH